ncbi:MAG: helix-turn-helix domain-containing protein [Vulcanococcus sp.]
MTRETKLQLRGPGLSTLLDTQDFGCWDSAIAQTLGHHHSRLHGKASGFQAQLRWGELGQLQILHIRGEGAVELIREQCEHAVLWLPLKGISEETINGATWLAEPETALLFKPGDAMHGFTSPSLEGISLLIPPEHLPHAAAKADPLIASGPAQQALVQAARNVAVAAVTQPPGAACAAADFTSALQLWGEACRPDRPRERITAVRRRQSVAQARDWIEAHLHEPFSIGELADALELSIRQLQYNLQAELGRTPMAEVRRLRLHQLRRLLQCPEHRQRSIARLMEASGLLASGATAAAYRDWFGEKPSATRRQALGATTRPL